MFSNTSCVAIDGGTFNSISISQTHHTSTGVCWTTSCTGLVNLSLHATTSFYGSLDQQEVGTSSARNTEDRLIASLAYQLALSIPDSRIHIQDAID